ncbi:hypothetical protein MN869_16105 [Acinetobacter sp. NIPH1876]|uniref:hypothetical protein n=1 Tax=unclassified Acinetobacter TaxID=196816 RepID=UPI001FAC03CB|nr:hypothetical protein [Acinetobacter sp. NIPH1876]MCJ0829968.1 hypothetical protein [Acinetobacter sp. NIPH1876]
MNETLVWTIIFVVAGFIFFWAKNQKNALIHIVLIVALVPLIFISYLSAHKFYYYLAVNSPTQQQHCGIFHQYQTVKRYSKTGDSIQYLYEFKTEQGQIFIFANNRYVAQHLPIMADLQPKQKICFQYSPKFKDSDEHYLLTGLNLQN